MYDQTYVRNESRTSVKLVLRKELNKRKTYIFENLYKFLFFPYTLST